MTKKQQRTQHSQISETNDISNNIAQLAENAAVSILKKENKTLTEHNIGLSQTIDIMTKALEEKDAEISHLKSLLTSGAIPVIGDVVKVILTDEEIIAEQQLQRLKVASMSRELTLDEVKRLDLLVKNKRLAQSQPTTIEGTKKEGLPKNLSTTQLIQIASKPVDSKPEE